MKDVLKGLLKGKLIMLPQNFYAEAFKLGEDKDGESCIVSHPDGEPVVDLEILGLLMEADSVHWVFKEKNYEAMTYTAFSEYFAEDGDEYDGPLLAGMNCNRCGTELIKETELDYPYYCPNCDENMYSFESNEE